MFYPNCWWRYSKYVLVMPSINNIMINVIRMLLRPYQVKWLGNSKNFAKVLLCRTISLFPIKTPCPSMQIIWPWLPVDRLCHDLITLRQKETWTWSCETVWDCDFLHFAQYIQSVHMVLTVNKPDVRRCIAWIESADWTHDASLVYFTTIILFFIYMIRFILLRI